jgi:antitoxin CcdA
VIATHDLYAYSKAMPVARKKKPVHPRAGKTLKGPKKKATNVMLREDLLAKAKELGLNMSAIFEDAITKAIKAADHKNWLEENAEAIRYANEHAEKYGLFADTVRTW